MTRALALQLCRKEFPQRWKLVKQVKYLLGGKRVQHMWIDTLPLSLLCVYPHGSLNYSVVFLLGFLQPFILICLVHGRYLMFLRILSYAHASLSQDGFYHKGLWVEHPLS